MNSAAFIKYSDATLQLLQSAASEGAALSDAGVDMAVFEARCTLVRFELDSLIARRARAHAAGFSLPPLKKTDVRCSNPTLRLPGETEPAAGYDGLEAARKRAQANLEWLPVGDLRVILEHERLQPDQSHVAALLAMHTTEHRMFDKACRLMTDDVKWDASIAVWNVSEDLELVVEMYRKLVAALRLSKAHAALLAPEVLSRELLVVWIATCLCHKHTCKVDPLLRQYAIPLDPDDLTHLVLSERRAVDAARNVVAYLRANRPGNTAYVFSLREQDKTFELSRRHAEQSSSIRQVWETEQQAAAARQEAHWKEVQKKQARLRVLDAELRSLEQRRDEAQHDFNCTRPPSKSTSIEQDQRRERLERDIELLTPQIYEKKNEISRTAKPPAGVLQPLPRSEPAAMAILFWLQMPTEYQVLSRLCFTAQQMLLPKSSKVTTTAACVDDEKFDVDTMIKMDSPKHVWREYYLFKSTSRSHSAIDTKVVLGTFGELPNADSWYPPTVRNFTSPSDGIWHPDSLSPIMCWSGGKFELDTRGGMFNPFRAMPRPVLVQMFTTQLEDNDMPMQWAMEMEQRGSGSAPERGNVPEAVLDVKLSWLSNKPEQLAFGALRAYPKQQMRKLLETLHDRKLPLDQPAVRLLLQQTLFQLGVLSLDEKVEQIWRTDLREHKGWEVFCAELSGLAKELRHKPREHGAVLILGQMAAHASQWHPECRDVAREFAQIARTWADDLDKDIAEAAPKNVGALRAKRCLFCMYGIVCHEAGALSDEDIGSLCASVVLADYNRLFEDPTPLDGQVDALTVVTQSIVARRLRELLANLDEDSRPLTAALKLVLEVTPDHLPWTRVNIGRDTTTCYEAVDGPNLFSVNVLTGTVLLNGLPPRRLPAMILQMPLYVRTFFDRNFEVVMDASGALQTTRAINHRVYSFFVNAAGALVVREREDREEGPIVMELLDGTPEAAKQWGGRLPIRLRHMHSHWLRRDVGVVILRPRHFDKRDVQFFLSSLSGSSESEEERPFECFRIPEHLQKAPPPIDEIKDTCDRLVLLCDPANPIVRILCKFETDTALVHTYCSCMGALQFELPRFGLRFQLAENSPSLQSLNFLGFQLSARQQLDDTLHTFEQYLVFESGTRKLIIVPWGVVQTVEGRVVVVGNAVCNAERKLHKYEVHARFGVLEAAAGRHAILARLQLAALYAATGSAISEERSGKTGGEVAIELVRQCWTNRPLDHLESEQLRSVASFNQLTPALPLLCHELDASARELSFLHSHLGQLPPRLPLDTDAAAEYVEWKHSGRINARQLLTADEESHLLGHTVDRRSLAYVSHERSLEIALHASSCPANTNLGSVNDALLELAARDGPPVTKQPFPLDAADFRDTKLASYMVAELQTSWEAHHAMTSVTLAKPPEELPSRLHEQHRLVRSHREELEEYLLRSVSSVPQASRVGPRAASFNMLRAANLEPQVTLRDLARAALAPDELLRFNPFLSTSAEAQLHAGILDWLQYCVLEDQLMRMCDLAAKGDTQELERELQEIGREWSVQRHPEWLVFEVEQQLKIRRVQYITAQHQIDNPGTVTQLNMGEGKTRVIIPMLHLYLARHRPGTLVRLHFLSQLLGEAFLFLHRHLTASLMNMRLCLLPFHRDVKLTVGGVRAMREALVRCMRTGGALCVTPEHRLSLQLKWHELRLSSESVSTGADGFEAIRVELDKIDSLPYCDLLDESDEVLRHKYQLIYAWGACKPLPAGAERWVVAEALLRELQTNPEVEAILAKRDVAKRERVREQRGAGAFDDIRLLPGEALDEFRERLIHVLAAGVVDRPPYEMRWLQPDGQPHPMRSLILKFVTSKERDLIWLENEWQLATRPVPASQQKSFSLELKPVQRHHLLAMRGLLACGLLEHCASRRFRVDFGVDPRRGVSRRVAVPYRASDTPAERAEYAQPDTLILLTLLSYYHSGLTRDEITQATRALLALGKEAQKAQYELWLSSAKPTMSAELLLALDKVDKLDLTSASLLDLLCTAYSYNMAAIDFWLNSCVLPRETMQFPHRLVSNAFNLTDNPRGQVIGFSGTKDNHLLLPLPVRQCTPDHQAMRATDGKMLALIHGIKDVTCLMGETAEHGAQSRPLSRTGADSPPRAPNASLAERVLELVVQKKKADALIDAGAAMAGLTNARVAEIVRALLPEDSPHQGVVYFEPRNDTWYVLSCQGARAPLGSSPIHERDAFVYFDESRCRGADMKLRPKAFGAITLGPGMCKDKLMQAAGRLRKLDRGQTLMLVVPAELISKIRLANKVRNKIRADGSNKIRKQDPSAITSLSVLNWVMQNTVQATADGLPEWVAQGSHFCTTKDPKARLIDESLDLEGLYGGSIAKCSVYDHVKRVQAKDRARVTALGLRMSKDEETLMEALSEDRAKQYGSDAYTISTGLDEECERELENERELEREAERQYPRCAPQVPEPWDLASMLTVRTPSALPKEARVLKLSQAMERCYAKELTAIAWDASHIFATTNYVQTVLSAQGSFLDDLGDYMRPLEWVAVFPSMEVLLLSEWEAEVALGILWSSADGVASSRPSTSATHLVNLFCLREAADSEWASPPQLALPKVRPKTVLVSEETVAGLQLLAGETMFGPCETGMPARKHRHDALATLLPTHDAKKAALSLPMLCGLHQNIARSDLELFCNVDINGA